MLGGIAAGAAVSLASLFAALTIVVAVLEPTATSEDFRVLGFLLPIMAAMSLLYFAVASVATKKAARPRAALAVSAVVTAAICGLWMAGGMFADSLLEVLWTALGSVALLTVSLLLGSEALYRVVTRDRSAGEA